MKKQSVSTRFLSILLIAILLCQIFVPLPAAAQEADKSASNLSNTPAVSSDVIDLPVQADITLSESLLLDSPKTPVKKITVTSGKNLSFIDQNQTISSEFYLDTEVEYDTVSVTYMSSDGIEMKSESFVSEALADGKMTISFVPLNDKIGMSVKDVRDYSEDTILANVSYWKDEIVEATEAIQIHTLSTPYGTFVSEVDPIINKRNYNRYLLRNEIIDEYTYEDLNLEFHYFGEEREDVTYQMADFSSLVTMAEKTAITNALSDRYVTSDTGVVTLSTTENTDYSNVDIKYNIIVSDSGET